MIIHIIFIHFIGGLAQSEERNVSNVEAPGSKPGTSKGLFRDGVVGNISACHADARGSIPRRGVFAACQKHTTTNTMLCCPMHACHSVTPWWIHQIPSEL